MRHSLFVLVFAATACATASSSGSDTGRQRDVLFDEQLGTIRTAAYPAIAAVAMPATPDKTWGAIIAAYSLSGIEVKYLNRPAGELGNRDFTIARRVGTVRMSRYFDCGTDPFLGPQADVYPIKATLVTRMWPDGAGTKIETRFSGSMKKPETGDTAHCSSTGALERVIAAEVSRLTAQPPT